MSRQPERPIVGRSKEEFDAKVQEVIARMTALHEEEGAVLRKAERLLRIAAEMEAK